MKRITFNKARELVGANHEAAAYVVFNVCHGMNFETACDNENLYGNRVDIVAERDLAAAALMKLGC